MLPTINTAEHLAHSGRQFIPLFSCTELTPGELLDTTSASLLRVSLRALGIQERNPSYYDVHVTDVMPESAPALTGSPDGSLRPPYETPAELPPSPVIKIWRRRT